MNRRIPYLVMLILVVYLFISSYFNVGIAYTQDIIISYNEGADFIQDVNNDVSTQVISIDGNIDGRTFEGLGALSAGASSRLLMDYFEPYRSQILDFLFKPKFGASLQHFKVEMGGDINSTDGSEASHARTKTELLNPKAEYYNRGYEWDIMKEAKIRNNEILLDALQWGAPSWIGNGNFYSQDNADYIVAFVKGAKTYNNLDIDYVGVWNERYNNTKNDWILTLRNTLNNNNLNNVKIIAPDSVGKNVWLPAKEVTATQSLKDSIYAIGIHYPSKWAPYGQDGLVYTNNVEAQNIGKPLWASEDGTAGGDWNGASYLAKIINRNYIENKITKTIAWSLISSYFDNLPYSKSGLMMAEEPWSGSYEVQPAVWVFAHTTQFSQPGWKYIDSGCKYFANGGSVVTLKSPTPSKDFSIIAETLDSVVEQNVEFSFNNLSTDELHIWKTNSQEQFIYEGKVTPIDGKIIINLEPESIYSITNTTGQHKGTYDNIPKSEKFPSNYFDDFESYSAGKLPKYFSDQSGAFETCREFDGTISLRQVVTKKGICWYNDYDPYTFMGEKTYSNYEIKCSVIVEETGTASIYGRLTPSPYGKTHPSGYGFTIDQMGNWKITINKNNLPYSIKTGSIQTQPNIWHTLCLRMLDSQIIAFIDGNEVANFTDNTYSSGMGGLGSGYNFARFDNYSVSDLSSNWNRVEVYHSRINYYGDWESYNSS